jgi:anti-anti-sigma regulatory factor
MLKITRAANGEVVFKLIGRMGAENTGELEELIRAEASDRRIVLDLKDLTLVDQEVVSFLGRCETRSIQLRNCPTYIRKWIAGEGGAYVLTACLLL